MLDSSTDSITQEPFGPIGIICHTNNYDFVKEVSSVLYTKRQNRYDNKLNSYINTPGYLRHNYILDTKLVRFQTGEGKVSFMESVRGHDIFIITDVLACNSNLNIVGYDHIISPDDTYRDLLRIISACAGKAKRINIIMPFLYEGVQVYKAAKSQESLDCAQCLKDLYNLGVSNLIIFDPHDARVANAVPLLGIETPKSAYKIICTLLSDFSSIKLNKDNTIVVSPDESGISRAVFYSSMLNLPLGIFYKQKDYSSIVNGVHPITDYKFLGDDLNNKDVLLIDDIINSGNTLLTTASKLKERGAKDIYCLVPFGLFNQEDSISKFNIAYKNGMIKACICTNLIYRRQELIDCEWFYSANLSPYVARIIDALNVDESVGKLINSTSRITEFLEQIRIGEFFDEFA